MTCFKKKILTREFPAYHPSPFEREPTGILAVTELLCRYSHVHLKISHFSFPNFKGTTATSVFVTAAKQSRIAKFRLIDKCVNKMNYRRREKFARSHGMFLIDYVGRKGRERRRKKKKPRYIFFCQASHKK